MCMPMRRAFPPDLADTYPFNRRRWLASPCEGLFVLPKRKTLQEDVANPCKTPIISCVGAKSPRRFRMKTKELDRDQTISLIELTKKRLEFNNNLKAFCRKFMRERGLDDWRKFNGFQDDATPEMRDALKGQLEGQDWMPKELKAKYIGDCGHIFGGVYSCAENAYIRNDLKDLERHLEEIESSADNREEENSEFRVERDLATNRLNIFFDYVPDNETRTILKRNGFRWSRFMGAWTRQLTQNAEASLAKVKREMGIE